MGCFFSFADTGASTIITIDSELDSLLWIFFSLSEETLEFQKELQSFGDTATLIGKWSSFFLHCITWLALRLFVSNRRLRSNYNHLGGNGLVLKLEIAPQKKSAILGKSRSECPSDGLRRSRYFPRFGSELWPWLGINGWTQGGNRSKWNTSWRSCPPTAGKWRVLGIIGHHSDGIYDHKARALTCRL